MSAIKTVAMVGASGDIGTAILKRLQDSKQFKIKVLQRLGSKQTLPAGTDVVGVDFASPESLTSALAGQEAVVSTIGGEGVGSQKALIDAAIAVGVKRFVPSEFGSNLDAPKTRKLPVFAEKVKIQDYLKEKAKTTGLTYTFVYNGAILDWGIAKDIFVKLSDYKPTIINGGNLEFSSTTLPSMGDAVVGLLRHPDETKNRTVYIEDIKLSQNDIFIWAKEVAPEKPWSVTEANLDDMTAAADERLAQGLFDMQTFFPYLMRAVLDLEYGGNFVKNDNELLGVKGVTKEDVLGMLKAAIY